MHTDVYIFTHKTVPTMSLNNILYLIISLISLESSLYDETYDYCFPQYDHSQFFLFLPTGGALHASFCHQCMHLYVNGSTLTC